MTQIDREPDDFSTDDEGPQQISAGKISEDGIKLTVLENESKKSKQYGEFHIFKGEREDGREIEKERGSIRDNS